MNSIRTAERRPRPKSRPLLPRVPKQPKGGPRPPRLDAMSEAWLSDFRRTARLLPHLDAESVGARVEQHLVGAAA